MEKTPWHLHMLAIGLFTVMVVGSGCFSRPPAKVNAPPAGTGCKLEAKMCADGSTVGRVPPSCEFAPCPAGAVVCPQDLKVCPGGASVGRYPPTCDFADCPPEHWTPPPPPSGPTCKNTCGNGQCDEIVCMAVGCPCAETKASCPQDCR